MSHVQIDLLLGLNQRRHDTAGSTWRQALRQNDFVGLYFEREHEELCDEEEGVDHKVHPRTVATMAPIFAMLCCMFLARHFLCCSCAWLILESSQARRLRNKNLKRRFCGVVNVDQS